MGAKKVYQFSLRTGFYFTKYNPGDKITLKVLRAGKELNIEAILGERTS
jgi:S1-C subfamily serine protease